MGGIELAGKVGILLQLPTHMYVLHRTVVCQIYLTPVKTIICNAPRHSFTYKMGVKQYHLIFLYKSIFIKMLP